MKLSIIIVSYNVCELLDKCLKSISVASGEINHEVFVVDNNSIDNTAEFVAKNYPKVKLIANITNKGFSKANNQAIKLAKGQYILILNPDTELMPDTLVKMLKFIESKPDNVAVVTCKVELPNGQIDKDCRRSFPTPLTALAHFAGLSKIFKGTKLFDTYYMGHIPTEVEAEIDACVGAFILIRHSALKTVGSFDEDYFFYGEDLDLCYRMRQRGYKVVYTPITKIIHHKGVSSGIKKHTSEMSKTPKASRVRAIIESTRAMELFYKKHYTGKYPPPVTFFVMAAIRVVKNLRLLRLNYL